MGAFTLLLGQVVIYLVLSATITLAALQNVTVDDAVTTGPVVPQYFPSGLGTYWKQGNGCTNCAAKPDPAKAYDGTWHDATFGLQAGLSSELVFTYFEVAFVGSALYIYFILTNDNAPLLDCITSVNVTLDGVTHPPYLHTPTPGAGYQYDVPVFTINSLPSGTHTATVQPFIPTYAPKNLSLMLFDYLVYTTGEEDITTSPSPSAPSSGTMPSTVSGVSSVTANPPSSASVSATASSAFLVSTISALSPGMTATSANSSRPNIGAVVGGTVAGVGTVALVAVFLLCYWRHKKRVGGQPRAAETTSMMEPFIAPYMAPTPTSLPIYQTQVGIPQSQFGSGSKRRPNPSPETVPPPGTMSVPVSSDTPSGSRTSSSSNNVTSDLVQEIGLLRGEVARLRERQDEEQNLIGIESEAPPGYFTS